LADIGRLLLLESDCSCCSCLLNDPIIRTTVMNLGVVAAMMVVGFYKLFVARKSDTMLVSTKFLFLMVL
jgi:hypothetical protein